MWKISVSNEDWNQFAVPQKVEAIGGNGVYQWDEGSDYQDVTNINGAAGPEGIRMINFSYYRNRCQYYLSDHGVKSSGSYEYPQINIDQSRRKECLVSVEGYYNKSTGVIRSLQFKTNTKTSKVMGVEEGTKFSLSVTGKKIIGFYGSNSENNLTSLGAYFIKNISTKSPIQGGTTTGNDFDDGGEFDGIRKVYVTFDGSAIRHLKIDYEKAGQVKPHERGVRIGTQYEFKVNHQYEYITSVEVTHAVTSPYGCTTLTSLLFKTSMGRTSQIIGKESSSKFVLQNEGNAIVGFHGRVGDCIYGIGAYYNSLPPSVSPLPPLPPSEKLEGKGGNGGNAWDDGAFKNVKKVYVGQGDVGIVFVKFEYENEISEVVLGEEHGKQTLLGTEYFDVAFPSEYITSVEGCYDKIMGSETGVITMLKFKTNKKPSKPFGLESGSKFILEKQGHKIIGFHGKSSNELNHIGVHVVPITE